MKRTAFALTALAATGILLASCSASAGAADAGSSETTARAFTGDLSPEEVLAANSDYTTVNDDEWSADDAVDVALDGSTAEASGDGVSVDGSTVTVTAAGVYRLSGSLEGAVVVEAPEDAQVVLILDGAEISNADGPAIEVRTADDVAINLASGSENTVSDAASYAEDATVNAAIDASSDLTISGDGSLTVTGNGNDGISSTDDLVVLAGRITVSAADGALRGKDALVVEGVELDLTATAGDGLKSNQEENETQGYVLVSGGTIGIAAGDDGIQALTDVVITGGDTTIDAADHGLEGESILTIGGGTITVTASNEGMQAISVGIFDGTIDLTAVDDGINASGINAGGQERETDTGERLEISGGTITIDAGFDGLDSNGSVTVSGGDVTISSAANGGDNPIDANGTATVEEGVVVANGEAFDPDSIQQMPGGPGMGGDPGQGGQGPGEMPGGGEMPAPTDAPDADQTS